MTARVIKCLTLHWLLHDMTLRLQRGVREKIVADACLKKFHAKLCVKGLRSSRVGACLLIAHAQGKSFLIFGLGLGWQNQLSPKSHK